jgi:hypothetical protein
MIFLNLLLEARPSRRFQFAWHLLSWLIRLSSYYPLLFHRWQIL